MLFVTLTNALVVGQSGVECVRLRDALCLPCALGMWSVAVAESGGRKVCSRPSHPLSPRCPPHQPRRAPVSCQHVGGAARIHAAIHSGGSAHPPPLGRQQVPLSRCTVRDTGSLHGQAGCSYRVSGHPAHLAHDHSPVPVR
ncbi:hypothetical protein CC85DRAFT_85801 [Cutaneotrichosporon oleaginosum]|uniref:Uncharacterized protein n=1 Tax=Cutaneotrichosporon oleaginosum TaxID=879819 RepID=A0A0J0XMZ6_9TREE|nr:uncharacterized protein CC85DRAFT_85801 [Cutaneotrichosporon oleaginosum]KLT42485.1 hypothetical protein CC85DRAFT_85801 [Cutaneotrichosporon oleaginosum]TXT07004.1 hypothetical protein COLE_06335 [Cutaneotrichosporon oleaginosum]